MGLSAPAALAVIGVALHVFGWIVAGIAVALGSEEPEGCAGLFLVGGGIIGAMGLLFWALDFLAAP